MKYMIRRAEHTDAEGIIAAHVSSIRLICSADYTEREIAAWSGRKFKAQSWCQVMDRDFVWVVELDKKVEGFGHLALMDETSGEIMGLYLTPSIRGKGCGRALLKEIIEVARAHRLEKLSLFSTKTAKKFYEGQGFYQNGGDTSIEMQGVPIECYPMLLELPEN
ncbi:MAG: GNAT family N-acetyltransferase [Bacteriovoracia bacterium]